MKKKMIGIFVVMLLISSAITTILYSNNGKVEASGGEPQGGGCVNLYYDWVWRQVQNFSWVINRTNWSAENNIPKGRFWATAGENYTISQILWPCMGKPEFACGLTDYTNISIGYLPDCYEPGPGQRSKQYSSKIVIQDYNLTIYNNSQLPKYIPSSELFPIGVGTVPFWEEEDQYLNQKFNFTNATIKVKPLLNGALFDELIEDHRNVSCTLLNAYTTIVGQVLYLNTTDPVPENHDCVFILHEELASENKLENLTDADGCILIENSTKSYTFENSTTYNFAIMKLNGTNSNFSAVLSEIKNGSVYAVDNIFNNEILVFSNYSNASCCPPPDFVNVVQLSEEDEYDKLLWRTRFWRANPRCKGVIMSSHQNETEGTHVMTHAVRDWNWFGGFPYYYKNRYSLPILSVNRTIGEYLINNRNNVTVTGFLRQEYRQQTNETPGVISHNVVAYRNISNSTNFPIAVLSNRMDGYWSEAPGDSGVGGAILLGIAKYFHDNNITPKYNLLFLFTTGEEYGMRGAQHFVDSHPKGTGDHEYNFIQWIGFDQLGFNYSAENTRHCFYLTTNNKENGITDDETADVLNMLGQQTEYEERTHDWYDFDTKDAVEFGAEDYVWDKTGVNTILFEKADNWLGHHQVGNTYQDGDSLANIDQNDVNVTFELAWNVTKYFTVNPNCYFQTISYEATNARGGIPPDSLQTTVTVKSILPSDLVMINASFYTISSQEPLENKKMNFTANRTGVEHQVLFTMPSAVTEDDYYVTIEVYNSTARINQAADINSLDKANDIDTSPIFHLSHYRTLGDIRIGTATANAHDIIRGSKFTPVEDAVVHNITAYVYGNSTSEPTYQCMIYRMSDGNLTGYSNQVVCDETGWVMFTFSTKPILIEDTQYMLTIWGNNENAIVYSTPVNAANAYCNASYTFGTPPSTIEWDLNLALQQYSIFCWYTPDIPQITSVSATPHTVGFGYNVTISADVTDRSGVNQVKVQMNTPEGPVLGNYTMTRVSGNTYQYVFSNTWDVGQYNYTIWATDNSSNTNSSTNHHFHISADATISIATLQDSYTGDEYINITDPPDPPENYTLVGRGLTWDRYYNAVTGQNILEVSTGPLNYQEDNGTWKPINTTLSQLPSTHPAYVLGYHKGNNHGLYGLYFKSNAQQDWPVAFTYNRSDDPTTYAIRTRLMGVGYVDPASNWAYVYLQSVQSSQGQTTGNSITYENVFTGTDVTWSYGNTGMKEEIILSNTTKTVLQNHPPSLYGLNNETSYLVFITKLDHQNLNMHNSSGVLDGNVTITESGVDFKDALGRFACALPLGEVYELNNESLREKLTYRIIHLNGNTFLLSGLRVSDLTAMTFPVVIDPSLTIYTDSEDGYLSNSSSNYNTVWNATTSSGFASFNIITIGQNKVSGFPTSTYTINRGFVFFNTSVLPSNAIIDNATLRLYKSSDYSTTEFDITVQNGQPTYPHSPLDPADYYKAYYSGDGGNLNTTLLDDGYNNLTLNDDGISWINTTGEWTKLCLRSGRDINGIAPTGNQYVSFYATEQGTEYTPRLIVCYRNQSKIKNTGLTDIKGYILIQVQFYNTTLEAWVVEDDTVNETLPSTIEIGYQLPLDRLFNDQIMASDLTNGEGLYRVYTEFRDPSGNVLRTNDETELKAWWEFTKT